MHVRMSTFVHILLNVCVHQGSMCGDACAFLCVAAHANVFMSV